MRRINSILLAGLVVLLWGAAAPGAEEGEQEKEKQPTVVEGRLIDLMCYVTMDMSGDKHAKCALQCAQKGLPAGLLEEETGKLYTVLAPSPGLAPYMERMVRLTGKIHKETLLALEKLEVREGESWKEVELPSAM